MGARAGKGVAVVGGPCGWGFEVEVGEDEDFDGWWRVRLVVSC